MKKNKKCLGCGVKLQSDNILNIGYTPNLENDYCMRCFKVKNYGISESITSNKEDYINILKSIKKTKDLVLYIVDILNLPSDIMEITNYLDNDIFLVLNKRDVLPKSIKDEKIISYLKEISNFKDYFIVSTFNNLGMDDLYKKVLKNKKRKEVYLVDETNDDKIKIEINNKLTLVDTPGIVDNQNIIEQLDSKYYKLLNTKKEIKPRTYQINKNTSLLIGDFLRIDYLEGDKNSFTFYIPNSIPIKRINIRRNNLKDLAYQEINMKFHEDLVIYGLGFIKIVLPCKVGLSLDKNVKTFVRKNLI